MITSLTYTRCHPHNSRNLLLKPHFRDPCDCRATDRSSISIYCAARSWFNPHLGRQTKKHSRASTSSRMAAAQSSYNPPLALTVISSISIGVAGIVAVWIALDIVLRRGWNSMMAIMCVSLTHPVLSLTLPEQDTRLCRQCPLSLAHHPLDIHQVWSSAKACASRRSHRPCRSSSASWPWWRRCFA